MSGPLSSYSTLESRGGGCEEEEKEQQEEEDQKEEQEEEDPEKELEMTSEDKEESVQTRGTPHMAQKSLWKQLGTNLLINVVTRALRFYSLYFLCALKKSTLLGVKQAMG